MEKREILFSLLREFVVLFANGGTTVRNVIECFWLLRNLLLKRFLFGSMKTFIFEGKN